MPFAAEPMNLMECLICGRYFEENRLCQHQEICQKSVTTKRKPFDSFKQRITGTMMEKYAENIKARLEHQVIYITMIVGLTKHTNLER